MMAVQHQMVSDFISDHLSSFKDALQQQKQLQQRQHNGEQHGSNLKQLEMVWFNKLD